MFNVSQDLSGHLPFNPLDCFAIHFKTILIQFPSLCFGFSVHKWSPVYPALAQRRMILHWQTTWLKLLNKSTLILSDLVLLALPYIAPITAISQFPEYQLYYMHEIVQWPCEKVIFHTPKYMRNY